MVGGDEVPTWVPDHGDVELAQRGEHVGAVAVGVREWVSWVVDAAVNASAHVPDTRSQKRQMMEVVR